MKINKGKSHSTRVRKPWRGSSHAGIICSSFTNLGRKNLLCYPSRRKWDFSPCLATNQPMRKHCHSELLLSSNEIFFKTAPSKTAPLLYKGMLLFVLSTCLWFITVCMFQIALPLLFSNKLIFASKITSYFVFKIDRVYKGFKDMGCKHEAILVASSYNGWREAQEIAASVAGVSLDIKSEFCGWLQVWLENRFCQLMCFQMQGWPFT